MAEKKTELANKREKELKKVQKSPVKKTTINQTINSTSKKTTTKVKNSSAAKKSPKKPVEKTTTTKETPSKTTTLKTKVSTPKKESTTIQAKKSGNVKSTVKKETNKKTTTPKKKGTTVKNKTTSKVKIKENTTKTKANEVKKKKEPIKKITFTKKVEGKPISSTKKEEWITTFKEKSKQIGKNIKLNSFSLLKKINVNRKQLSFSLKNTGGKLVFNTKEIFKKSIKNLKNSVQKLKEFLKSKKGIQKNGLQKSEKIKIIKNEESLEQKEREKKIRRILLGIAISCLVLAILLMIPYGVSTYKSGASNKILDVPKFMKPKEECCNYSITFSSPRSVWALKKDVEKIISRYDRLNCDGKNYYYNAKENYTVTEYGVHRGIFLNQVYFTYGIGNSCDIDTKFKKLELLNDDFSVEDAKKDGNFVMEGEKIYNKSAYDNFMANVNAKIPSTLRIVTTTKEGDVIITDLEYLNSGKFLVSYDATRDRNNKNPHSIVAYKFEYLKLNKNKLYAYNGDKLVIKNAKKYETFYLLTLPND